MSTEQRDIRAIGVVPALQDLLAGAFLLVGDKRFGTDEKVVLDETTYLHAGVAVDLGGEKRVAAAIEVAESELPGLDLSIGHLEFAVILYSGYLRILEFRHRMPLAELSKVQGSLVLTNGQRPDALRAWRSGCSVELSVHLSTQRPRQALKPWRLGSWVAKSAWSVVTDAGFAGFVPKPLTPEKKQEFHIAPKAMRYIRLGSSPLEDDVTEESVELWLDADLLAKVSANPKTKFAVALQRQLFVDSVAAVVHESRVAEQFDMAVWDEVENTLLGRVISLLTPNTSTEAARRKASDEFLAMVKADPARFMSYIEDAVTIGKSYDEGLDG